MSHTEIEIARQELLVQLETITQRLQLLTVIAYGPCGAQPNRNLCVKMTQCGIAALSLRNELEKEQ